MVIILGIITIICTFHIPSYNAVVDIGFDSEVYSVSEGTGNVTLSVRRPGNSAVELARPIAVRVSSMEGSATGKYSMNILTITSQLAHKCNLQVRFSRF